MTENSVGLIDREHLDRGERQVSSSSSTAGARNYILHKVTNVWLYTVEKSESLVSSK